jgi:hypothetical protein
MLEMLYLSSRCMVKSVTVTPLTESHCGTHELQLQATCSTLMLCSVTEGQRTAAMLQVSPVLPFLVLFTLHFVCTELMQRET